MTFGLLKARSHCLHKLRVSPVRACDITVACGVLHNVACLRKERAPRVPPAMDWDNPEIFPDDNSGRLLRDQYVLNYFSQYVCFHIFLMFVLYTVCILFVIQACREATASINCLVFSCLKLSVQLMCMNLSCIYFSVQTCRVCYIQTFECVFILWLYNML